MIWLRRIACILVALLGAPAARADVSALLIAVSDYDDASGIADLKGPPNDVRLLEQVLRERGITEISVLSDAVVSDGADQSEPPTRAAILSALAGVAEGAKPGDFVYIHYSGHGSRQRDQNGDETDGLDEVILPADAGGRAVGTGLIANAITDDELGAAIGAIRARGADVWLVLDSCNSGTALRSGGEETAVRYVDPATLGQGALAGSHGRAPDLVDEALPGKVLAFYAAQSSELARELNMAPEGSPEEWYGLFSARLAARLQAGGEASFRQLFQSVLGDIRTQQVSGAARLQTPYWEGELIDAPLFGQASEPAPRRFGVVDGVLAAGTVHGFTEGALFTLLPHAGAGDDEALGQAQIEKAGPTKARLRLVGPACTARANPLCDSRGPAPKEALFAQLEARPVDLALVIAPPVELATGAPVADDHAVVLALSEAIAQASGQISLSAAGYDIETAWDGRALWFAPRAAINGEPLGLAWTPGSGPLAPVIDRIVRAETLARLLGAIAGSGSFLNPSPVAVETRFSPVSASELSAPDAGVTPQEECSRAIAARGSVDPVAMEAGAVLKQCDQLGFDVRGVVAGAWDVNRVHIDAQFCIHASHERVEDAQSARKLGPDMTMCSDCPSGYSAGDERLFVVASEAQPGSEPLNLVGLVENCGPSGVTRGGHAEAVDDFLGTLARARVRRNSLGASGISNIWVDALTWTVLPKPVALARQAAN